MAPGVIAPVHEDEDNWFQSYIATTKFGSNAKLNSLPVKPKDEKKLEAKKLEAKKEKTKKYKLHSMGSGNSRRRSISVVSSIPTTPVVAPKVVIAPEIEALPERVNAIREGNAAGHFVREHRKSKEHPEFVESSARKFTKGGGNRRLSLEFDELDAVKLRLAQAAHVWEQERVQAEDSEDAEGDAIPVSALENMESQAKPVKAASRGPWFLPKWSIPSR